MELNVTRHAGRGGVRSHAAEAEERGSIPRPLPAGGLNHGQRERARMPQHDAADRNGSRDRRERETEYRRGSG